MKFDNHIFISYAHIDNETDDVDPEGWVTRFDRSLKRAVDMKLGQRTKIWRDKHGIDDNQDFGDEISDQLPHSAVLVSIVSEGYSNSPWCKREASLFCEYAENDIGLKVDNDFRIFKVEKAKIEGLSDFPNPFKEQLGTSFYTFQDNTPMVLEPHLDEHKMMYRQKMNRLADSISRLIKRIASDEPAVTERVSLTSTSKAGKVAYLAECSFNLKEEREEIEEYLLKNGYEVLPNRMMARDEATYEKEVNAALDKSDIAIHLISSKYGAVLDGPTERSIGMIQNELAAKKHQESGLPRIIWLPEGIASENPVQQSFIDAIRNDKDVQAGAEVIEDNLESFKTNILEELQREKESTELPEDHELTIFISCTEEDRPQTIELRKFMKRSGFVVEMPVFEGHASEIRKANQEALKNSDAAIIFYGVGKEAWRKTIELEMLKARSKRGQDRHLPYSVVLVAPTSSDKVDLIEMEEEHVVSALEGFDEKVMEGILKDLKSQALDA